MCACVCCKLTVIIVGASIFDDLQLDQVVPQGHAVECRVYAEDPSNNFFPSTGTLLLWEQANLPDSIVRYDTGICSGMR
jgi:acetyl/propionyl-CoA carboxylase alpha subunit